MGVECAVLPMSETPVRTVFSTAAGERLEFHDYFVKRRQQVEVAEVIFEGAAQPPRAALVALREADVILLTPSNPILSIAPVLHALGDVVHASGAAKAGVSPIVGGRTIKGPAAALLESLGHEPTAAGAAATYAGLLDVWVMDDQDAALSPRIRDLGMRPVVTDTIMRSQQDAARLAKTVLESL
jgi:LPPG:FO 2-phospho-L-lactate transferase